jgi:hypothetical protein
VSVLILDTFWTWFRLKIQPIVAKTWRDLCHYKRNSGAIIFFSIQKKYVAHVAQGCF